MNKRTRRGGASVAIRYCKAVSIKQGLSFTVVSARPVEV